MKYLCPDCGKELRKRAMSYPRNVKKRSIESVYDRYVCSNCKLTFDEEEVQKKEEEGDPEWLQ